jgi:NAD(P)-dependent dehydrogenase (short-subunit alcohol dehydrogenase family)
MLTHKIALVTGGTSGIGLAIARRFLRENAAVAVAGRRPERCEAALESLKDVCSPEAVLAISADVTREKDVKRMVETALARFGRIDILVNSAGYYLEKRLEDTSQAQWNRIIDVNLKGVYLCCRQLYPHFRSRGKGVIVNISSDAGLAGNLRCAAYCAAKAGVSNLTRALALDYARENIRVNAICPGVIDTPMLQRVVDQQSDPAAYLEKTAADHPVGRIGTAEQVAFAVLMIASDEAGFTTGANISVDGGLTA